MPLLDHFNLPLSRTHPWRSFLCAWATTIARLLNHGILPAAYYALPIVERDDPIGIAGRNWAAPAPGLSVAVELPITDAIEVQVFADDGDHRLAAVVELVSPRNKDRHQARQVFAAKCAGYLQQGRSVVVVDIVTTHSADLHAALLSLLGVDSDAAVPPSSLSALAYRAVGQHAKTQQLQVWLMPLALGQCSPTLPLWIASDLAVPLDLEASYQATCADLRIR